MGLAVSPVDLRQEIVRDGFAFVHGADVRGALTRVGSLSDWPAFAASWNDLAIDTYMGDGGRYRRRRHAVFSAARGGEIMRQPDQPHVQAIDYNPLNGGVERWFQPVDPAVATGSSLQTMLAFCLRLFGSLAAAIDTWRVEVHQFRIEARAAEIGRPTPEGLHRDGVDYVLVLLVARQNVAEGTTSVHALDGRRLGSFTLTDPFDAALVEDSRVAHGVTPIVPIDPHAPAYRDVIVVTFRRS